MQTYLIAYGQDNLHVTFEADDHHHAVEQFISWSPISSNEQENRDSITDVALALPIEGWDSEQDTTVYAVSDDGSWFATADLELVTVPASITDADEVEDFIVNNRGKD